MTPERRKAFLREEEVIKTQRNIAGTLCCLSICYFLMICFGGGLDTNPHKGVLQIGIGCIFTIVSHITMTYALTFADEDDVTDRSWIYCLGPAVLGSCGLCFLGGCIVEHPDKKGLELGFDGWTIGIPVRGKFGTDPEDTVETYI